MFSLYINKKKQKQLPQAQKQSPIRTVFELANTADALMFLANARKHQGSFSTITVTVKMY